MTHLNIKFENFNIKTKKVIKKENNINKKFFFFFLKDIQNIKRNKWNKWLLLYLIHKFQYSKQEIKKKSE